MCNDLSEFRVSPRSADVWTLPIRTEQPILDELGQTLSPDEWERALRFRAEEHRDLFIAGRAILRMLLSCYISERPAQLVFRYGPNGKPHLRDHPGLHFSLAHSGGHAVYAVGTDDLGIDIELVKSTTDWQNISRRFFSSREVDELEKLDPAQQTAGFFACWTRKEAYLKATGEGLRLALNKFYAGAILSRANGVIEEDGKASQWFYKDLRMPEKYAGAIVTRYSECGIRLFEFARTEDCVSFVQGKI